MMLSIQDLTCGYESGFAVRDINLTVKRGEILGLIGPNGCGKTTLLRAITGALKPSKGRVLLENTDLASIENKERARSIAVVSQGPQFASMTVEEFVLLGRMPYFSRFQFLESAKDREIANEAMTLTDSLRFRDHSIARISGGEQQLAMVARALAQQPKLLLLDEPTAHLDITHQVGVLDLVRRLNRKFGLTVIIVLHDLNLAAEYCHRMALLDAGNLRKIGTPEEVMDYRIIEEVYKTVVVIGKNPVSARPHVMIVSEETRMKPTGTISTPMSS